MSDPDKKNDTTSDENLKFEEPELSVEEVNTRKLQAIAVISFGLIALLVVRLYFFKELSYKGLGRWLFPSLLDQPSPFYRHLVNRFESMIPSYCPPFNTFSCTPA